MGARRAIVGGAVGGAVGSALMLPLFETAKSVGLLPETPPRRVVDHAAAEATGPADPATELERTSAMVAVHVLYGAAAGACYGVVQEQIDLPAPVAGPAFGLALWAAGYLGWLPAAGILPQPWRQQPGAALTPVVAHVVYGLALGFVARSLRR